MKMQIKNHKHLSKDGGKVLYSMEIKDLPEVVFEQVMKLIDSQCPYESTDLVDDTKPTNYPYQHFQCKMTGVHLTRRGDNGNCTFCGVGG